MRVYFLRHAVAEPKAGFKGSDADRPLTREGIRKFKKAVDGMLALGIEWNVLYTSPYKRALETAEILAESADVLDTIKLLPALKPDNRSEKIITALRDCAKDASVILVGHEPSLSSHLWAAVGCPTPDFELKKGGMARVDFDGSPALGRGKLQWILTPRQFRQMS